MKLSVKRCAFTECLSDLILAAPGLHPGARLAYGEGYVALTDGADGDHDGPHKKGGAHYTGLGMDLLLYVNGTYITDGDHPAWQKIGAMWEQMNSSARWGGRFEDANHFSFEHEGRK